MKFSFCIFKLQYFTTDFRLKYLALKKCDYLHLRSRRFILRSGWTSSCIYILRISYRLKPQAIFSLKSSSFSLLILDSLETKAKKKRSKKNIQQQFVEKNYTTSKKKSTRRTQSCLKSKSPTFFFEFNWKVQNGTLVSSQSHQCKSQFEIIEIIWSDFFIFNLWNLLI